MAIPKPDVYKIDIFVKFIFVTDWAFDWLSEWLTEWMSEWVTESLLGNPKWKSDILKYAEVDHYGKYIKQGSIEKSRVFKILAQQ